MNATAVTGAARAKFTGQAETSRDAGGVEEGRLRRRELLPRKPAPRRRASRSSQRACSSVRVHELERLERHAVQARGLLVGEERERAISGPPGVAKALVEVAAGDRVVRELGEVGLRARRRRAPRAPRRRACAAGRGALR